MWESLTVFVVRSASFKNRSFPAPPQPERSQIPRPVARLDGWNRSAHDQTLVLALRKGCYFS